MCGPRPHADWSEPVAPDYGLHTIMLCASTCSFRNFVRGFFRNSTTFLVCADGTVQGEDCLLLELEDVAKAYKRPSIIDIKVHTHFDDSIELPSPLHLLLVLMLLLRKEPATGPSAWRRK